MDTGNGRIIEDKALVAYLRKHPEAKSRMAPMELMPTAPQLKRKPPRVGRNEPCPCGSGQKFKKCCLQKRESPA